VSGIQSVGPGHSGRASLLVARALLALLCLLSVLSGPSPVLCLESDGGCAGEPLSDSRPASCHDEEPAGATGCESCTDVPAPEESLGANRVHHAREVAVTTYGTARFPVDACSPGAHTCEPLIFRPDPTPLLVRTTVLLI
jgi:hypothetical protein